MYSTIVCPEGSSRRRKYRDIDDIDGDDVVYDDEEDEEDFVPEDSPQPTRRQVQTLWKSFYGRTEPGGHRRRTDLRAFRVLRTPALS